MAMKIGMLTGKMDPLPLLGVRVTGDITGRIARIKMAQRYRNMEKTPLEVVYRFPLPEQAAICGFRAMIGESIFEGVVEEREEAFRLYDEALEKGYGAYLLDQERPNIFTVSLGNLPVGKDAVVEMSWLMSLEEEEKRYRFCLPTTIAPRYFPGDVPDEDGIPAEERVMPPYAPEVSYGLSLSLDCHCLPELGVIESPSHPIKMSLTGRGEAEVSLGCESVRMDRDFILYLARETGISSAWREKDTKYTYYQADICLPAEDKEQSPAEKEHREFIFVLDCSGSMEGDSINHARRALEVCLKALEEGCRFNIYRFGSNFEAMFDRPAEYTEANIAEAMRYVKKLDADLGGTELFAPLDAICSIKPDPGWKREVVVITDGEIGNEEQVGELVKKQRGTGRFSVLGIGAAANDYLVASLSRAGGGFHGYVFPGENIELKTVELFARLNTEIISDVKIILPHEEKQMVPKEPLLFPGRTTSIFCRTLLEEESPSSFEVHFSRGGKPGEINVPVKEVGTDGPVRLFWAREAIRGIEEGSASVGSQQKERRGKAQETAVINLSKEYGLMSSLTSMVAVEKRADKDRTSEAAELRRIPALVAAGWHGFPSINRLEEFEHNCFDSERGVCKYFHSPIENVKCLASPARSTAAEDDLVSLLNKQNTIGGFSLDAAACKLFKLKQAEIKSAARRLLGIDEKDRLPLVSTALVLAILEKFFADSAVVWKPVTRKSKGWIDKIIKVLDPKIDNVPLMEWAREYVKANAEYKREG